MTIIMKKIVLAVMLAAAASLGLKAQSEVNQFSLKPMVGVSSTEFYGEDAEGTNLRWGFAAGVELEYQVSNKFSVSAIPMYAMGGAKVVGVDGTWKNDKIMIPVMANFYMVRGMKISLGVQPGFVVKSSLSAKANGTSVDVNAKDYTRSFDFSIPLGLSYEWENGLSLSLLWHLGVTKVMDKPLVVEGIDLGKGNFRNTGGVLTLGYKFEL
ncbi:MAG TPA: hypothetical protein DCQ56_00520 [Porphyromonadaceae bacterium]|nr:hypothetical protein [Porphyromonadaceae bacterium]